MKLYKITEKSLNEQLENFFHSMDIRMGSSTV